ncbi:ImmA/IrrE family metallo-endopeptidase [Lonepinella koalarum]|uniref:ImmA/IrrE family metallo-endopeptidase n=1 Tax=Lonepinella koalarum TaxID=53417 RepID=UPI003F6DB7A2
MSIQSLLYQMNGYRVSPMTRNDIAQIATPIAKQFGLNSKNRKQLDKILEKVSDIATIDILSDEEWQELTLNFTKGHYSPAELTIRIPERTYIEACQGDYDALEIILHEMGHLFLTHQTFLHKSDIPPTQFEDAEWQADTFAEIILEMMGYNPRQLRLDFGFLDK